MKNFDFRLSVSSCLIVLGMIGGTLTGVVLGTETSSAYAQEMRYTVNGKSATKDEYDAVNLVQEATKLTNQNKIDEAALVLRRALFLAPRLEVARINFGFILMRLGKYNEAIEILKDVVDENPKAEAAWLTLGGCYQTVGRIPEAIDAYKRHMKLNPTSPDNEKYKGLIETLLKEASKNASAIAASPPDADTYLKAGAPLGVKWPDKLIPIQVYIPKTSTVERYKPHYRDILIAAFNKWAVASHGKLSFEFVDQPDRAKLLCDWSHDPSKVKFQGEGGHAVLNYMNQDIHDASVLLLTIDPSPTVPLTDVLLAKVALHEVGHALGLIGHSSNRADIMFFSMDLSNRVGTISERDSKTLRALYVSRPEKPIAQQPATVAPEVVPSQIQPPTQAQMQAQTQAPSPAQIQAPTQTQTPSQVPPLESQQKQVQHQPPAAVDEGLPQDI